MSESLIDFRSLLAFLQRLQKHNSREWMEANRKEYRLHRARFMEWLEVLDSKLGELDTDYSHTPSHRALNRINNNLKFHPDRPVYKDHFGAALDKVPGTADFYIEIGLNQCLLAGGLWRPEPQVLSSVRQAIDYDGDTLQAILEQPAFRTAFGDLYNDQPLKTAPKGYSRDHPHIQLLRHRTFAVIHAIPQERINDPDFQAYILEIYMLMLPFRRYLNRALSV